MCLCANIMNICSEEKEINLLANGAFVLMFKGRVLKVQQSKF